RRTALVGIGKRGSQRPVLCFELQPGIARPRRAAVADALRAIAATHAHTAQIERFLWHPRFPVDIRHNAKIGREKLAAWAAARTGLS
ncbi:MAG TPA: peptide synthase, partial [Pseudoxanthomonas sp.]|nr:peptide synthase [Pseudoxanthomonas sp.]